MKIRILTLWCALLAFSSAYSQKTVIPASEFGSAGLPYSILDMMQDSRGFMWFATMNGLVQYDGYSYTVYQHDPADTASLSHDFVSTIIEDMEDGAIWAGTNKGLNRFDPRTGQFEGFYHEPEKAYSLPENVIVRLAQDKNGYIWIGTLKEGLVRLDKKNRAFEAFPYHRGPSRPFEAYSYSKDNRQPTIWGIVPMGDTLWTCTYDGLHWLIPETGESQNIPLASQAFSPDWKGGASALRSFGNGQLLYRVWTGEAYLYEPGSGTHQPYALPAEVETVDRSLPYTSRQGNTWLALANGGFKMQSPYTPKFRPFGIEYDGFTYGQQGPILDSRSHLWLASTGHGLLIMDKNTGRKKRIDFSEIGKKNSVWSIAGGRDGTAWISNLMGLAQVHPEKGILKTYYGPYGLSECYGPVLMHDSRGRLWLGTLGYGVAVLDPEAGEVKRLFHRVGEAALKDHNQIVDIEEDSHGNIWIGTYGGGLYRVEPETFREKNFQMDPSRGHTLSSNQVNSILEDKDGRIWLGTGRGLNLLQFTADKPSFRSWTAENSKLPNNRIFGLVQDEQGYLWLSTDAGISRFHPDSGNFLNFSSSDGFLGVFEEQGDLKYQGPDGRIYFYSKNGMVSFHPDSLAYNPHVPPVVITGFHANNEPAGWGEENSPLRQPIAFTRELELPWWQNNISFEFAALDYVVPEKNRYRYQLLGHDGQWVNTTASKRFAGYNNLAPGHYTLRGTGQQQ